MKVKDEREVLEKMINDSATSIGQEPKLNDTPELSNGPTFTVNFEDLQKECEKKAGKMIHSATGFMFSDEIVKENSYLRNKIKVDILSLAGMIYQLSINETMQKALMEEVRSGAMHPRNFEVFSQITKNIADLNKQTLQTVEAIKMTYKDLKNDIREAAQDMAAIGTGGFTKNENGIIAMGTKELIKETKKLKMKQLEENNIQDAEEIK